VVLVGDRKMRQLNSEFASHAGTTDVLAFDLADDDDELQGEVIVNAALAIEEAHKRSLDPADELLLYVVHGVLHLGGFRDNSAADKRRMRSAERTVMKRLKSGRPSW
jgi:probable rRNA maturation factor